MTLQIKEGKYYRTRDGRKVGPVYVEYGEWVTRHEIDDYSPMWNLETGVANFTTTGPESDMPEYDLIAEWTDETETQPETGTLAELNVKPGDVVAFSEEPNADILVTQRMITTGFHGLRHDCPMWRIVSRASQPDAAQAHADTPKLWRDMTPEEKGALLLAHREGKVIEIWDLNQWLECDPLWADEYAYRIRPEPKRETVTLFAGKGSNGGILQEIGTIEYEDGKPDPASIRMEEI